MTYQHIKPFPPILLFLSPHHQPQVSWGQGSPPSSLARLPHYPPYVHLAHAGFHVPQYTAAAALEVKMESGLCQLFGSLDTYMEVNTHGVVTLATGALQKLNETSEVGSVISVSWFYRISTVVKASPFFSAQPNCGFLYLIFMFTAVSHLNIINVLCVQLKIWFWLPYTGLDCLYEALRAWLNCLHCGVLAKVHASIGRAGHL